MGGLLSLSRWLRSLVQGHGGSACAAVLPAPVLRLPRWAGPWQDRGWWLLGAGDLHERSGGGGGSDATAIHKECREGDRGTVLVAACNPHPCPCSPLVLPLLVAQS